MMIYVHVVALMSLITLVPAARLRASSSATIGSSTAMDVDMPDNSLQPSYVNMPDTSSVQVQLPDNIQQGDELAERAALPPDVQRFILRLRDGASLEEADKPGDPPSGRLGRTVYSEGRAALDE